MTLTSTGVSRDNGSSASGSSKTLKQKDTKRCCIREKHFVLSNKIAAGREITQREGEGKMKHVLPSFLLLDSFATRSISFINCESGK